MLEVSSGRPADPRFGWGFVGSAVSALRGPDQDAVIQELYDAGTTGANPLETIGAYKLLSEWEPNFRNVRIARYLELLDSFLTYLREHRYSSGHLTRYEVDRG